MIRLSTAARLVPTFLRADLHHCIHWRAANIPFGACERSYLRDVIGLRAGDFESAK